MLNVLIACEESQRVCIEFRKLGFNAFSCDILKCSGGHPEWHINNDVENVLNGNCYFITQDQVAHMIEGEWDLIIAHPPCTYLTVSGNRWFNEARYGERAVKRKIDREEAIEFFLKFVNTKCKHVAIENPVGIMSTKYRKPDQIIEPYYFGDPERKATCLWLKNLSVLVPTEIVHPNIIKYKNGRGSSSNWHMKTISLPADERRKERSKTFPGIAKAMANQWGTYLMSEVK